MARGALGAGARLVASRVVGELADLAARARRAAHPVPDDIPLPRLALGALVAPLVVVLFRMGMLPEAHAGARQGAGAAPAPARRVRARRRRRRATRRASWRARSTARSRSSTAPVASVAWPRCAGSSRSTRTPRRPRSGTLYPELDHNEICGWGQHGDVTRQVFTLVELHHGLEHPQLERRVTATREMIEEARVPGAHRRRRRGRGASPSSSTSCTSATGRATTSPSPTTSTPAPSTPSCSSRPASPTPPDRPDEPASPGRICRLLTPVAWWVGGSEVGGAPGGGVGGEEAVGACDRAAGALLDAARAPERRRRHATEVERAEVGRRQHEVGVARRCARTWRRRRARRSTSQSRR